MKKIIYLFKYYFVLVIFFFTPNLCTSAIEEMELKLPPKINNSANLLLKGNVKENIEKPQTGIGVIGLRFIHQAGYPSYIEEVYPDSPASRAGIKTKDLIFAIDGIRTDYLNSDSVYQLLTGEPGTKVRIFLTRGQTMFNVEIAREDLVNLSPEVQNRYLSGPIAVPVNIKDLFEYH